MLWWLSDDRSLSPKAVAAITDGENMICVSAVTAWAISVKRAMGKLKAPTELEEALEANRFHQFPISIRHARIAGELTRYHDDPMIECSLPKLKLSNYPL